MKNCNGLPLPILPEYTMRKIFEYVHPSNKFLTKKTVILRMYYQDCRKLETRTYFHSLPEVKAIFFLMLAYENTTPRERSAYYLSRSNGEESEDSDDEETPRAETPSMIKRNDYHTFLSDAFDRIEETKCFYKQYFHNVTYVFYKQYLHNVTYVFYEQYLHNVKHSAV